MDGSQASSDVYSPDHITFDRIGHELGFEKYSDIKKNQHSIERLIEWGQLKGAKNDHDIVSFIKELAGRIGAPTMGNNWAKHLSTYAYLEAERLRIEKELQFMSKKEDGGQKTNTT